MLVVQLEFVMSASSSRGHANPTIIYPFTSAKKPLLTHLSNLQISPTQIPSQHPTAPATQLTPSHLPHQHIKPHSNSNTKCKVSWDPCYGCPMPLARISPPSHPSSLNTPVTPPLLMYAPQNTLSGTPKAPATGAYASPLPPMTR